MVRFAAARLLAALPVLLLVSLVSFSVMHLIPGDPASVIAGPAATNQEIEQIRQALGLDRPFLTQMATWYGNVLQGDFGQSILLNTSVWRAIVDRLPITFSLSVLALLMTVAVGVRALLRIGKERHP